MSLNKYKAYLNDQMLVITGQMDSASEILDYLYLVSRINTMLRWNKFNL